ncbi:hypothetical protein [Anabaena azotica]|uniref:hypothetical protein n=1 Tax=Anabaena azotica TaxID=197653 RepID=UPI0039A5A13B
MLLLGIDFHATFTVSPVSIVSSNLSLLDRNSSTLTQATITITNPLDGLQEFVFADTTGTAITADYNSATATLTLSGIDTVANYQKVLRTVEYFNTAANPNTTARTIEFVVDDGEAHSNTSAVATTTITFTLPDFITGTNSSEVIVGTNTINIIDGKRGNDVIYGYEGDGVSGVGSTATVPTLNPAGGE